jgi:lipoprotein-releasing system permease protein
MSLALGLEWRLATRFLRPRSGRAWLSFSAFVCSLGVTVGVLVMIVVLAVMNGFDVELKEKVLAVTAHATLTGLEGPLTDWQGFQASARRQPHVLAAAPFIEERALLAHDSHVSGVLVRGVDPAQELTVANLGAHVVGGSFAALAAGQYQVLLGKNLAEELHVGVGDSLVLAAPHGTATPAGVVPRMRRLHVAGLIDSGLYEFDRNVAVIHIQDAARIFRLGDAVTGIALKVDDPFTAGRTVHAVAVALGGGFFIYDWSRAHANFFRSIATTKSIMLVLLSLVIAVAAFNIIATLVMLVREKRSDIAILRTLGLSPRSLVAVFVMQGLVIGGLGLLLGVALGLALAENLKGALHVVETLIGTRLFDSKVYFLEDLPAVVGREDVLWIIGVAVLLSALATLYPAWRAARTQPAEALRHD